MSKSCSAALKAFLASTNPKLVCDLFSFFFKDGLVIYLTSFSSDVTWNGHRYSSMGPRLTRGTIKWMQGIQVQEVTVSMAAPQTALASFGLTYQRSIMAGLWDGCECSIDRVYFHNPPRQKLELQWDGSYDADKAGRGAINLFYGRVGEIDAGPLGIAFKVQSLTELFNMMMPRNLYQPNCRWSLYDAGCGLQASTFMVSGAVQSGSTSTRIFLPDMNVPGGVPGAGGALPPGWLSAGKIQFVTGRLSGAQSTIAFFQPSGTGTYDRIVLRDEPIAYYPLATDASDLTNNHYNGTAHGGVTFSQPSILSQGTSSTLFDGSTGYITLPIPSPATWPPIGGWCFEIWLNPNLSAFRGAFDSGGGFTLRNYVHGTQAGIEVVPQNPFVTPLNAQPGQGNHIVVNISAEVEINVYINNDLAGSSAASKYKYVAFGVGGFWLGRAGVGSPVQPFIWYQGYLQSCAFYPYPLNETQISEHYETGTSVAASVPVAYADLLTPLPFAPQAGDLFQAFAGCDLSRNQCNAKFSNLINFGGAPDIPDPTTALSLA